MGKGKKPTKSAEKTAIKQAKREAKRAAREASGAPKPNHLILKAQNKAASKAASALKKSQTTTTHTPKPFLKTNAKWPSLFKRHIGLIESHIKSLDRVMQSMKSELENMGEKEREEYELEEGGHWRRICGMLDRSREVLVQARECGVGVLPSEFLRDKKGLGVSGMTFERLEPGLRERAEKLGYNKRGKVDGEGNGGKVDREGDSEMEDVPSLSSDADSDDSDVSSSGEDSSSDEEKEGVTKATAEEEKADKKSVLVVEPNPYFVIDTQPMPVRGLNKHPLPSIGKSKESEDAAAGEPKKNKKSKKEKATQEPVEAEPESEPTKEEPAQKDEPKKSKKRTHDDTPELKKSKKSKKEKATIPIDPEPATTQPQSQPEPEPAAAPPKKSKKRANSTTSDTDAKKSKKHKSIEPEAVASIVDFNEIQRKLQAEVDAGEAEKVSSEKKKKRRRSSGEGLVSGGESSVKKVRKGKD